MSSNAETNDGPVLILGLGGGGAAVVRRVGQYGVRPPLVAVVADTDHDVLESSSTGVEILPLSGEWTAKQGAGGDAMVGERAAAATSAELEELIRPARLILVATSLAGGTGAGAARVVTRIARQHQITTILVGTLPFSFEGSARARDAEAALAPLCSLADIAVAVPNDTLFNVLTADTPATEAFAMTDQILARVLLGLARLSVSRGLLPADLGRLNRLLHRRSAHCCLGAGSGEGDERWKQAVEEFLACPLLGGDAMVEAADFAVLTLTGPPEMGIGEVRLCLNALEQRFDEDAQLIVGTYTNPDIAGLEITGVLGRYTDRSSFVPGAETTPSDVVARASETNAAGNEGEQKRGRSKKERRRAGHVQAELPLQEQKLGIFAASPATSHHGDNLDIPTFQRRGVQLDLGT